MMDDDFNTAGAIGVMHEMAGEINAYIEQNKLELSPKPEQVAAAAGATQTLRKLGMLLGLFRKTPVAESKSAGLADQLMELIIQLRNDVRKRRISRRLMRSATGLPSSRSRSKTVRVEQMEKRVGSSCRR